MTKPPQKLDFFFYCFLFSRFGVYVPLCCFHQEGGKSQAAAAAAAECDYQGDHQQADLAESPFLRPRDFLFLLRENLREQFSSPPHMPTHTCPPHTHSDTPELIRAEVEELKSDFNRRIKEVLFNSLFSAYYVAFLPLCFVKVGVFVLLLLDNLIPDDQAATSLHADMVGFPASTSFFPLQSTQYYDMRWSCEHLIMVWINAFVMLMSQLLPPSYCDLLHRSAAHLGRWQKLEHGSYSNAPQHV